MDREILVSTLENPPFHKWLGVKLTNVFDDGIEVTVPWRDEIVSNSQIPAAHGGVLAAIIDFAGYYALLACDGNPASTVDLRVDYHRPATKGDLIARARIIKMGSQVSTAECTVCSREGRLFASGRGVYATRRE